MTDLWETFEDLLFTDLKKPREAARSNPIARCAMTPAEES
jgi:hypothetical protein